MTSSALELESDRRVLKRPWIFEKSWPTTFVTSSIASCDVTMTQTRPAHLVPSSSTIVWRLSMRFESPPMNWPISSAMNSRRKLPPWASAWALA